MHNRAQESSAAQRRAEALRRRSGYNRYVGRNSSEQTPRQSGNASRLNLGLRRQFKVWGDSVLDACRTLEGMDFNDGVTLVDEEHEIPEISGGTEASHRVQEEPTGTAGHHDQAAAQHEEELERQPSIDSLLIIEETASPVMERNGQRVTTMTGAEDSSVSSQQQRLSVDSLHQDHYSEMEVSPMSSREG